MSNPSDPAVPLGRSAVADESLPTKEAARALDARALLAHANLDSARALLDTATADFEAALDNCARMAELRLLDGLLALAVAAHSDAHNAWARTANASSQLHLPESR